MKTLLLLLVLCCTKLSPTLFAADYIFTGTGEWALESNWMGGIVPPSALPAGSTITIKGNAGLGITCTSNCLPKTLAWNYGTITIAPGATLTVQNFTRFTHIGVIVVNGTLISRTLFEAKEGSSIIVNGTLINQDSLTNQGTITVNNNGIFDNQLAGVLSGNSLYNPNASGTLLVNNGGSILNKNTAVLKPASLINRGGLIDNRSTLSGNTVITGNFTNTGTLSPGNSPGTFTIAGKYTATTSSIHNFEVAGTTNADFDKLVVSDTVNLSGTLNISLINGFTPVMGHDLTIVTGIIRGKFSIVNKPAKYMVIYHNNSVVLRYNPSTSVFYIKVDVKKEGSAAKLSWVIHNELNVAKYEVERSTNGSDFKKIGEVASLLLGQYSFLDNQPENKSFYRIKCVDKDAKYAYSLVITYNQGKAYLTLNMVPSIVQHDAYIQHSTATGNSKLSIISIEGRMVKIIYPADGEQKTPVNLAALKAGVYIVYYEDGKGGLETVRFNKL